MFYHSGEGGKASKNVNFPLDLVWNFYPNCQIRIGCASPWSSTGWPISWWTGFSWLRFGLFHHPAWAVGSYSSGHQPGVLPKSKSTQSRFARRWATLYTADKWALVVCGSVEEQCPFPLCSPTSTHRTCPSFPPGGSLPALRPYPSARSHPSSSFPPGLHHVTLNNTKSAHHKSTLIPDLPHKWLPYTVCTVCDVENGH